MATTIPSRSFQLVVDALPASADTISILQFNALADALSDAFPHVSSKELVLDWRQREPRLHAVLSQHSHDFICAEEVDHFDDSFLPFLAARGYDGAFAVRRPLAADAATPRDGAALFWRRDRFALLHKHELHRDAKCFGIVAQFARLDADAPQLTVAAVHLTAKPGMEAFRQQEVDVLLAAVGQDERPALIGGDFNDVPDSLACRRMRDAGFASAYAHDEAAWTTWKKRDAEVKRVIDYIWHRGPVRTVAVLPVPPSDHFPRMLPDEHYPSDHMAIAAQLAFIRI